MPPVFVGRENELRILERALISGDDRTALILGPYGIGKSSLAHVFAKEWSHFFAGGIDRIESAFLNDTTIPTFERWRLTNTAGNPKLLILENLEGKNPSKLWDALSNIRRHDPQTRVIATSRANVPGYDLLIRLEPLSATEMQTLSELNKAVLNAKGYELLFQLTNGNPLAGSLALSLIQNHKASIDELIQFLQPFSLSGLVDPSGEPLRKDSPEEKAAVSSVIAVGDQLLDGISRDPNLMHALSPRRFEELIASLFEKEGYEVTLTPTSRDGGIDIYVAKKDALASLLFLVQCKRNALDNPVQVKLIRELYGVVEEHRATGGILATTSVFTKGAKEFTDRMKYRLSLQDYLDLHKWIQRVRPPR